MAPSLKILLIEDELVAFRSLASALEKYGHRYTGSHTLKEAQKLIKQEPFDIIISDIRLPDGSGLDLLSDIRRYLLETPFVVITASDDSRLLEDAMQRGASDYLTKPFNLKNIPTIIRRNMERQKIARSHNGPRKASALLKTIKALITALEAKDSYTSGHSIRVARHARMIGDALKLNDSDMFTLELAAILHDIGKIGMPDHILKKSTSLVEYEYLMAKEHPVIGSNIVGKIDELRQVAAIIRHHHERYDGMGYPDGLKGEVIPYFARLLAIVDAYESIISDRVYSKRRSAGEALNEIEKHAGSQFDPKLVELLAKVVRAKHPAEIKLSFEG